MEGARAQQVEEHGVAVEVRERCYSSPRSIQMYQSPQLRPRMQRPEAHVAERGGEGGMGVLVVVVVDLLAVGQKLWQNVEQAGVSQGQSIWLTISISITLNR